MMRIVVGEWDGDVAVLRKQRTDETKELRRKMKDKGMKFQGGCYLAPADDGCSNTVTTVQKDNLLIERKYGGGHRVAETWSRLSAHPYYRRYRCMSYADNEPLGVQQLPD